MAQEIWFVIRDGKEYGPYSPQNLKDMAGKGQIIPDDMVRRHDMAVPRQAKLLKGLFLAPPPPTAPPPPQQITPTRTAPPPLQPTAPTSVHTPQVFQHTNYLVRRKIFKVFGAAFHIYDPNGKVAFYSKQKAFKLKEDIRVYTGEDMRNEVLTIIARQIIDFSAAYEVFDPINNIKVGVLKRKGMKSIVRGEWIIMDAENREIGLIQEDSMLLSLLRRFLPVTNLIPQKYHGVVNGRQVCLFKQNFNPFVMKINLDFSMDANGLLDRRLGIAGAILLCAIEGIGV